jgi:hypothetical protein
MTELELMGQALAVFRKNPLVKSISKTKWSDTSDLAKTMSLEDGIQLFRLYRKLINIPPIKKVISTYSSYTLKIKEPQSLDELPRLISAVKSALENVGAASRQKIPTVVKKHLKNWVENNTRSNHIDPSTMSELQAIPEIRPDKKTLLFRGLLFSDSWFKSKLSWAKDNPRSPSKLVNNLLSGKAGFNLDIPNCSSWTTSKAIADRFASQAAATSQYLAMMSWLHAKGKIDGALGLILAVYADPNDIVVDLRKIDLGHVAHGDEGEMILAPGNYTTKIVAILTPDGEISLDQFPAYHQQLIDKNKDK